VPLEGAVGVGGKATLHLLPFGIRDGCCVGLPEIRKNDQKQPRQRKGDTDASE
jgi:hypothetical protein